MMLCEQVDSDCCAFLGTGEPMMVTSKHIENDVRFLIGCLRSLHQASVAPATVIFHSDRETFAAGTVCNCVRISDLEAAFLQVFAVIEHRAANKKRAFGIDNQANV